MGRTHNAVSVLSESRIVLGLLVSSDGYPLSYNVFNGSQYEGRTMMVLWLF